MSRRCVHQSLCGRVCLNFVAPISFRVSMAAVVSLSLGAFIHFLEFDVRTHKPACAPVVVCSHTCVRALGNGGLRVSMAHSFP